MYCTLKKVGTDIFHQFHKQSKLISVKIDAQRCPGYKKCYQFLCNLEFFTKRFSKLKFIKKLLT